MRDQVNGNYKGCYCSSLVEAEEIKEKINQIIVNEKFNT